MALDEAMRLRIHGKLEELLGHDEAAALMNELRPDELATKHDVGLVRQDVELLKHDVDVVKQDVQVVKHDVDLLRVELGHVEERLTQQIDIATGRLGNGLRTEMNSMMRMTTQWIVGSMLAAGSLGIAAGRLL